MEQNKEELRPLARLLTIHTKNYEEGETLKDERNRRIFESLSKKGILKAKSDMIVVHINAGVEQKRLTNGFHKSTEIPAEAVFVSCDCENKLKKVFHITSEEKNWLIFSEDFDCAREVKFFCSCYKEGGKRKKTTCIFKVQCISEKEEGKDIFISSQPIHKFFSKVSKFKFQVQPVCDICTEFYIEIKRIENVSSNERLFFPCFTKEKEIEEDSFLKDLE